MAKGNPATWHMAFMTQAMAASSGPPSRPDQASSTTATMRNRSRFISHIWRVETEAEARERIEEIIDPELTIERALDTYAQKGYSPEWINQRLQTIRARKELTDAWKVHGVKEGQEYAILTDEVTKAWSGMNTRQYKNFKGLKKENLRDNMSTLELALNMLAEATTTELTNAQNPQGLEENRVVAKQGGAVAGNARKEIESKTGRPVVTAENASTMLLGQTVAGMIESVATEKDDEKSE